MRCEYFEAQYQHAIKTIYQLKNQNLTDMQVQLLLNEQLAQLRTEQYSASTEKYKKPVHPDKPKSEPKPKRKKPSDRYPNIPIREVVIEVDPIPQCESCEATMKPTSMFEASEQLNVIPKSYEIILQKQMKYACHCHGCVVTASAPPRIVPGSSYSDEMILDVALSKYCDLIPIDRYTKMAGRGGLLHLPAHSLIETTHKLAEFVKPAYDLVRAEILKSRVLHADETPHKMLEGSHTKSWYLWGFSTNNACFLEYHSTRSGDVASDLLQNEYSKCEVLISDVFSGYRKAVRVANTLRHAQGRPIIRNAYCNVHARRYFFKAYPNHKDSAYFLDRYHEIYQLEGNAKEYDPPDKQANRDKMWVYFEEMKAKAEEDVAKYPTGLSYGKALRYFLGNYDQLTLCLSDAEVALDNNLQERLLRNHVVGRKTWYGTHSKLGAKTAAILFTLTETCKLNQVNPRDYMQKLTQALLRGDKPFLPV